MGNEEDLRQALKASNDDTCNKCKVRLRCGYGEVYWLINTPVKFLNTLYWTDKNGIKPLINSGETQEITIGILDADPVCAYSKVGTGLATFISLSTIRILKRK